MGGAQSERGLVDATQCEWPLRQISSNVDRSRSYSVISSGASYPGWRRKTENERNDELRLFFTKQNVSAPRGLFFVESFHTQIKCL